MPTFPYLRIHFLNTIYAFSKHCSPQKVLRNLAAAGELPDACFFSNSNSFVALKSAGRSLSRRKHCLERCQSSEDGARVVTRALTGWMRR